MFLHVCTYLHTHVCTHTECVGSRGADGPLYSPGVSGQDSWDGDMEDTDPKGMHIATQCVNLQIQYMCKNMKCPGGFITMCN